MAAPEQKAPLICAGAAFMLSLSSATKGANFWARFMKLGEINKDEA